MSLILAAVGILSGLGVTSACRTIHSMFIFGDSYSATGFQADSPFPTLSQPFGYPSVGVRPGDYYADGSSLSLSTASSGPVWLQYLAMHYNTTPTLTYNFAVGGASIPGSFTEEVEQMYMPRFSALFSRSRAGVPASSGGITWSADSSLFSIWIGINDINWCGPIFFPSPSKTMKSCLPARFNHLTAALEKLYRTGARRFLFINVPPLDRTPFVAERGPEIAEAYRSGVELFNGAFLPSWVSGFKTDHPDITTLTFDFHKLMNGILDRPHEWGFTDATCVRGHGDHKCVWADPLHPTHEVHRHLAEQLKAAGVGM
ncbi:cellulose-binding gdsl lipase acylhydrolase like protein [Zymoseptoria brevis]|uniref:Cellulose-binding gdsl lipase acylhydrolase like protein n=1 Tax=Zymoseptoria brevis TaxID=1047168 RepID=A0A0F4GAT0_9PEZI|nr:cellulose-binding gdsl lipase acylhydrolase like protein [Zymoseptoria brevis]